MKLSSSRLYRLFVFGGMLLVALSFGTSKLPFFATSLQAQTNAPTPAPAGIAQSGEIDKDTGKPIVTTPSGLKYVDLVVGTGPAVKTGDDLLVNYEGKLVDGTKFDSSYDRGKPFEVVLGVSRVIEGWTEGLSTMKVGGQRKLIIPPQLGYGLEGMGDTIPPNATLIFKVEIVSVKK